ncbi:MAG: hypothetical protein ACRYGR_06465 [Janthinobacterium lividum]
MYFKSIKLVCLLCAFVFLNFVGFASDRGEENYLDHMWDKLYLVHATSFVSKNSIVNVGQRSTWPIQKRYTLHHCGGGLIDNELIAQINFDTGQILIDNQPISERKFVFVDVLRNFKDELVGGFPYDIFTVGPHEYGVESTVFLKEKDFDDFSFNNWNYKGNIKTLKDNETLSSAVNEYILSKGGWVIQHIDPREQNPHEDKTPFGQAWRQFCSAQSIFLGCHSESLFRSIELTLSAFIKPFRHVKSQWSHVLADEYQIVFENLCQVHFSKILSLPFGKAQKEYLVSKQQQVNQFIQIYRHNRQIWQQDQKNIFYKNNAIINKSKLLKTEAFLKLFSKIDKTDLDRFPQALHQLVQGKMLSYGTGVFSLKNYFGRKYLVELYEEAHNIKETDDSTYLYKFMWGMIALDIINDDSKNCKMNGIMSSILYYYNQLKPKYESFMNAQIYALMITNFEAFSLLSTHNETSYFINLLERIGLAKIENEEISLSDIFRTFPQVFYLYNYQNEVFYAIRDIVMGTIYSDYTAQSCIPYKDLDNIFAKTGSLYRYFMTCPLLFQPDPDIRYHPKDLELMTIFPQIQFASGYSYQNISALIKEPDLSKNIIYKIFDQLNVREKFRSIYSIDTLLTSQKTFYEIYLEL